MFNFLAKIFGGSKSEKDVKELQPLVARINEFYEQYRSLSNDQLRANTTDFRNRISEYVQEITQSVIELKAEAESSEVSFDAKEDIYKQIDGLEKERDKKLEEVLKTILPEAFATIKECARRFTESKQLEASANDLDRKLSTKKDFVKIEGDKAIYSNTWNVMGIPVTWNMVHYDVQLIGGMVLHNGKIAEMATGEGKTLVATLAAYLNSLTGLGVHIVTVNDYLAKRDSEWNAPLFNFLGVSVDCIDKYQPNTTERRNAYQADITYGTNNEFGFDYLRDNMVRNPDELVQRKLHYAMVDEVDSVLVDDARTPLIISGPIPRGDDQQFHVIKPRIQKLVEAQKKVVNQFYNDARKKIESGNTDVKDGGLSLLRAHRGLPKYGTLIKYLSETGVKAVLQKTENHYLQDNAREMPKVDEELYFTIDEKNNQVEMTEKGLNLITESGEDKNFFVLPDVGAEIADIEKSISDPQEKINRKDALMNDFSIKSERIHTVQQLLKAYTLFERDVEYVVMEGKVKIVDEQTGRILDGRRYSDGLHQAIEAKENVKVEAATQTFATVTLQNYFRMYHKLAGMTGTAETEAGEFWQIYKLDVVVIPTNKAITRKDLNDRVYKSIRDKFKAVIDEIEQMRAAGRPVLVGTTSVDVSEKLSRLLAQRGVPHQVLNAKQHQREAEIVASAGLASTVTIATNMAGRGTDIKLGPGVREAGGLAIIGTERHESRRVDRQLRGRAGRQGDPGSSVFYISLEDDLMRLFASGNLSKWMDRMGFKEGDMIEHSMLTTQIEKAQKKVEENNFGIRKRLLEYDDVMNAQRDVIYRKRRHALFGERLSYDLNNMLFDLCEELVNQHRATQDYSNFSLDAIRILSIELPFDEDSFLKQNVNDLAQQLYDTAQAYYTRKCTYIKDQVLPVIRDIMSQNPQYENVVIPFSDGFKALQVVAPLRKSVDSGGQELIICFEKNISLAIIDEAWKEHLRQMDELKQSVQNAVYEQKDPLLIYKFEAFELFKKMLGEVNREVISFLFKAGLPQSDTSKVNSTATQARTDMSRMQTGRDNTDSITDPTRSGQKQQSNGEGADEQKPLEPVRVGPKIGRNDPCPCGSGKKYKQCHGKESA
ncbi:MAG: preprotein translocase subunit SecA [Bacteroidetes bacterium]|nr:preprotein translocase subunit SecA [Bacteroidota bacterium]